MAGAERTATAGASKVLGLVPARGGSKGLPRKNLCDVGGRSLLARAVAAGQDAPSVDVVVVSSDDPDILAEGCRVGAQTSRRPATLATDATPTMDVILWELSRRPDVSTVVLLQPTSPLRRPADVQDCLALHDEDHPVVTVAPVPHPTAWTFHRAEDGSLEPVLGWDAITARRQDASVSYALNGAVYVGSRHVLEARRSFLGPATRAVIMPPERSVDVDTELDLALARLLASRLGL